MSCGGEQTQGRWTSEVLQDSRWKISIQADVCACLVLEDSGAHQAFPASMHLHPFPLTGMLSP